MRIPIRTHRLMGIYYLMPVTSETRSAVPVSWQLTEISTCSSSRVRYPPQYRQRSSSHLEAQVFECQRPLPCIPSHPIPQNAIGHCCGFRSTNTLCEFFTSSWIALIALIKFLGVRDRVVCTHYLILVTMDIMQLQADGDYSPRIPSRRSMYFCWWGGLKIQFSASNPLVGSFQCPTHLGNLGTELGSGAHSSSVCLCGPMIEHCKCPLTSVYPHVYAEIQLECVSSLFLLQTHLALSATIRRMPLGCIDKH